MEQQLVQQELRRFIGLCFIFAAILGGLAYYDAQTNKIQEVGSRLFGRIIRQ